MIQTALISFSCRAVADPYAVTYQPVQHEDRAADAAGGAQLG